MAILLYHSEGATESPFDSAILRVARSGPVRIVSPYIGMAYLRRITDAVPEWRLLSDVEEWLRSQTTRERPKVWHFIRENISQIHHVPDLHAKAVISDSLAVMGSANLTRKGILGRTELGVLLDDPSLVTELCVWFDGIWDGTAPPSVDEGNAFVQWLDAEASQGPSKRQRHALASDSRRVRARLAVLDVLEPAPDAGLDLADVAREAVIEDTRHYDSLEAAFGVALDVLCAEGDFTFGRAAAETRKGFGRSDLREVYFLLVRHCANHVRSVFAEDTQNRLILIDGRFRQSTRDTLPAAMARFDAFLVCLIERMDFREHGPMPGFADFQRETGLGDRDQVLLVSELLDCGFLHIEDVPGELPRYRLDTSFDGWEGRFKFFPKACGIWASKLRRLSSSAPPALASSEEDIEEPSAPLYLRHDQLPEPDGEEEIDFARLEKEMLRAEARAIRWRIEHPRPDKKRKQTDVVQPDAPVPPRKSEPEQADAFLAKALSAVAAGKTFNARDWHALTSVLSDATGTPLHVVRAALDPASKHPKVFLVATRGDDCSLELNPMLGWEMLVRYRKTREVCDRLLGS